LIDIRKILLNVHDDNHEALSHWGFHVTVRLARIAKRSPETPAGLPVAGTIGIALQVFLLHQGKELLAQCGDVTLFGG